MMRLTRRIIVRAALALVGVFVIGATSPRAEAQLNGIDVSNYQGNVNWVSVKNAGYSFAFAKATEGTTYTDPYFAHNWYYMQQANIIRGAYHYGHPGSDPIAQARFFVTQVGNRSGAMQLVLDLETTDGRTPAQVWAWTQSFMAEIQRLTGKPGIIYTGYYFWRDSVGNPNNNLNCPLWIANYGVSSPLVPTAWSTWSFWQYSDTGSVPGVSGAVDKNYFNGTLTSLRALTFP